MTAAVARLCGAKTRAGTPCRRFPLAGRTRCRLHGGATPRGADSPHFIHGRYQRHLAKGVLLERVVEMTSDPDLLSLSSEIGFVDAITSTTLDGLEVGAALDSAVRIAEQSEVLLAATLAGDAAQMRDAMEAIRTERDVVQQARRTQDRALELMERRRRLVDTERRRLEAIQANITVAEAYRLMDALTAIVRENVRDPDVLERIGREFERVARGGARTGGTAGGQ